MVISLVSWTSGLAGVCTFLKINNLEVCSVMLKFPMDLSLINIIIVTWQELDWLIELDFTHLFSNPARFDTSSALVPPFELALRSSNQCSSSSSGTRSGKGEQRDMSERLETEENMLEVAVLLLVRLEADISLLLAEEDLRCPPRQEAVGVLSEKVSIASNRESLRSSFSATAAPDFSSWRTGVSGKGVSSGSGIAGGILASGIFGLVKKEISQN